MPLPLLALCFVAFVTCLPLRAAEKSEANSETKFRPVDLFDLEFASDPQISPDGNTVVFVRNFADIMTDRNRASLWTATVDGGELRPITTGSGRDFSPRWSPDGKRLLYASATDGKVQVYVRWIDTGQTARVTSVLKSPANLTWSPDGRWIAFTMLLLDEAKPFAKMPAKPEGADWAKPPRVVQRLLYRADGEGYLEEGFTHLFVVPAEGGTPRQLTHGSFHHAGPFAWTPDSQAIIFSANRREDWEFQPLNSDLHEIAVHGGEVKALTSRQGPDADPEISPDGRHIAYTGFDDREQGYHVTRLHVMNRDGSDTRVLTAALDRDARNPRWAHDGSGVYFLYDDQGNTKIGFVTLDGKVTTLARDVGGVSHSRPYAGGSYSVSRNDRFAFTQTRPEYPADIAVGRRGSAEVKRVTRVNDDLFAMKSLGSTEEFWCESSFDRRKIHGWIIKPPGFDPQKKYPFILEIHGGPFANYGDRFSSELQLFAAAGYVVLYVNPRGSTSYGEEFGNLIHRNYPGQDYDDLMSAVDNVVGRGYIDPENLFVTGGSGGGVLTAWIIGKTERFRAAAVVKPVIKWYSFVLTADAYNFFYRYWFPGPPWENAEHYLKRSPISLVGNVKTPTMLLTGESDYRTPISESEQYYQALKLRKVDAALVRIADASHAMDSRPTQLIAKVTHLLEWFAKYRREKNAERREVTTSTTR